MYMHMYTLTGIVHGEGRSFRVYTAAW